MAFVGIKISTEVVRLFRNIEVPGEKVDGNKYHITILCFEDNWALSEVSKAMEAIYKVISKFNSFHVKTTKITCFSKKEDRSCPIIAQMESKDLIKLNFELKKEFDKQNISYSKLFKDFKPHMTLSYADEEIKDIKIEPVEFFVHEIVLWAGDGGDDRLFITFPLKGVEVKKNTYLIQKADIFQKLSSKNPNSVFKPSFERRKVNR